MAFPAPSTFCSSRWSGKIKGVAAAVLGTALVAGLPASAVTGARAAAADQMNLRLWPSGQGRIDVVQNGSAAGSCDFVTILSLSGASCEVAVTTGVPVTLTAVPEPAATIPSELQSKVPDFPAPATTFVRWSRYDCEGTKCTFTPELDADWVTALFAPLQLEVGIAGPGKVSVQPATGVNALVCTPAVFGDPNPLGFGDTTCHALEPAEADIVLVATPTNAADAIRWGAGCEPEGGQEASPRCTVAITNIRTFASVAFGDPGLVTPPIFPFQITPRIKVHRSGSGHGKVTGTGGIDCGNTCTHDFGYQDRVTLKSDADSGSTFVRWRGVCSTNPTCVFAAGSATLVDAVFDTQQATTTTATTTRATTTTATTTSSTTTNATTTSSTTTTTTTTTATSTSTVRQAPSVQLVRTAVRGRGLRRVVVVAIVVDRRATASLRLLGRRGVVTAHGFVVPKGQSSLRLSVPARTPPGRYRLALRIASGGAARTVTTSVTIRR